ncbi:MAG: hypothetical protein Kow00106_11200 [Anaerolineae bacterium]
MHPFDEEYLARREKQIKELIELRAMTWACLVTGVALGAAGVALLGSGRDTAGTVLLVFAVLFGMATIFMTASYFAQKAADRAIQKEYELLALYGLAPDKAKRGDQEIRLADDGEVALDDLAAGLDTERGQRG